MLDLLSLITFLNKSKKKIFGSGILGVFVGIFIYIVLPVKYVSTGTFYITHAIEDKTDFNYEGYYAQQTAQAYTDVFINVLESKELKSEIIQESGGENIPQSYYKLNRLISIKKTTPQSITLEVKTNDSSLSKHLWKLIVARSLDMQKGISSDKNIFIAMLMQEPVTVSTYKNIFLNIILGSLLGMFIGTIYFCIKDYYMCLIYNNKNTDVKKSTNKK